MSYILEALKKAQAERQLGDVPTIHAPAIAAAQAGGAGLRNKPLLLALAALGLVTTGLLALVLRPAPPAVSSAVPTTPAGPGAVPAPQRTDAPPAVQGMPAVASPAPQTPAPASPSVGQAPVVAPTPTPVTPPSMPAAAPQPAVSAPVAVAAPQPATPAPVAVAVAAPASSEAAPPRHYAATSDVVAKAVPSASVAAASASPVQEEAIQNLRDLPEPIQRAIPAITMGGYMYSRNPADRLLLIDKVLRHEGEEVAPGLVLDKLQPKAAVFTFKGYRYRVPY